MARLVSASDLIVVANPDVPVARLKAAMLEKSPDYVEVPLMQPSVLKGGQDAATLTVKVYPKTTAYAPSPKALLERAGKPTLIFLTHVDQGPVGNYLPHSLEAVQDASASSLAAVNAEVRRQDAVIHNWKPDPSFPYFKQVHRLLAELPEASSERQAAIFESLEKLGPDGVPAIIAQMDDRRPLAHRRISLVNYDPNAFEGIRHYGPELVVDALDAILNQVTGVAGSIVNGGSERERRNAVSAWRVYAADLKCKRV
jgi:hypothetical protein